MYSRELLSIVESIGRGEDARPLGSAGFRASALGWLVEPSTTVDGIGYALEVTVTRDSYGGGEPCSALEVAYWVDGERRRSTYATIPGAVPSVLDAHERTRVLRDGETVRAVLRALS